MSDSVKNDLSADHIVADPVGPDLQPPLTDTFPLELFYFRRWSVRVCFEAFDLIENFRLDWSGKVFQISLEARRQANNKTGRHRLAGPTCNALLEVLPEGDALPRPVLLGSALEALLEFRIELFENIVKILGTQQDGSRLAALRDDESSFLPSYLLQERAELGSGDVCRNGRSRRVFRHSSFPFWKDHF